MKTCACCIMPRNPDDPAAPGDLVTADGAVYCVRYCARHEAATTSADVALWQYAPEMLALLRRTIPLLIRLGDFIGNGEINPQRAASLGERCDVIHDVHALLARLDDQTDDAIRAIRACAEALQMLTHRHSEGCPADIRGSHPVDCTCFYYEQMARKAAALTNPIVLAALRGDGHGQATSWAMWGMGRRRP